MIGIASPSVSDHQQVAGAPTSSVMLL